jgi:hypothetical protein
VAPVLTYTSFDGHRRIASGSLQANALAVKQAIESNAAASVLTFDDRTGQTVEVDTRGSDQQVAARFATREPAAEARGRGRPRLGVIAREVTLLPRHWDWLATQPGGASVALRKLVEAARRANGDKDRQRRAQERAYHFMLALAGDLPGYEEATRALFANDAQRFGDLIAGWPADLREHASQLAFGGLGGEEAPSE